MNKLKYIANGIFLALSIFLICYFLQALTNNIFIKIGICIFAIGIDIFMQYVLALGRAHWREKWQHKIKAVILFLCYAIYVFAYAVPSAVAFFMVEINTSEKSVIETTAINDTNKARIIEIDALISSYNKQLAKEADTGYGTNSKEITMQINKLSIEREKLLTELKKPQKIINSSGEAFTALGKAINKPADFLKIIIFGISACFIYLALILTSWDINLPEAQKKKKLQIKSMPKIKKPVTDFSAENQEIMADVTDSVTDFSLINQETSSNIDRESKKSVTSLTLVTKERICPGCEKPLPEDARPNQIHHDDRCRIAAFRNKGGA